MAPPFSGKERGEGNLVKTIRPKPWPGKAPGLLFGRTTALCLPLQPLWAAAGGTFNGHFRVLKNASSASKVQGGKQCRGTHGPVCSALEPGAGLMPETHDLGRGRKALSGAAPAGGHAGSYRLSPCLSSRKEGRGGVFSQGTAAVPMITYSPQAGGVYEGFGNYYNHLLCWVETDPVSLCFRALNAGEARRSRFQHKRIHNS